MAEAATLLVRGRRTLHSQEPKESLNNRRRTRITHKLNFPNQWKYPPLYSDNQKVPPSLVLEENGAYLSHPTAEVSSLEDLEESLRKLKVQVESVTSSLSLDRDDTFNIKHAAGSGPRASKWQPPSPGSHEKLSFRGSPVSPAVAEWLLAEEHLVAPCGDNANATKAGPPTLTPSPVKQTAGLQGSEMMSQASPPSGDLSSPLKFGGPPSTGVKSLLPPKTPVQAGLPERASFPIHRGRSRTLNCSRVARSCSFSPASKRTRWLRSRSQSPKPVWKPSSAKTNACAQPPPQLGRSKEVKNKGTSTRQCWLRSSRPGTLAGRSWATIQTNGKGTPSPYSLSSCSISSPTAQEISERFLQTLPESTVGRSLMEKSPYRKEEALLWLERPQRKEAWCLELEQELEGTRGPKPKWYEMRNSQFHYEARKNNELLRNSRKSQAVSDYRASKEFQQQKKTPW